MIHFSSCSARKMDRLALNHRRALAAYSQSSCIPVPLTIWTVSGLSFLSAKCVKNTWAQVPLVIDRQLALGASIVEEMWSNVVKAVFYIDIPRLKRGLWIPAQSGRLWASRIQTCKEISVVLFHPGLQCGKPWKFGPKSRPGNTSCLGNMQWTQTLVFVALIAFV